MNVTSEYDHFADIYDVWASTAPVTTRNLPFYVEVCCGRRWTHCH